ncbi:hypothetical protein BCR42DRAFT_387331 [Absidia repens]|uniref:Uncharacterized protein n=1 Tax=Absidia repens TaxID=90262 RepID=A0A1X2IZ31_9FUNG|nr:hypothetical protein BCR42DRAFT_387331 [Absidia repens]
MDHHSQYGSSSAKWVKLVKVGQGGENANTSLFYYIFVHSDDIGHSEEDTIEQMCNTNSSLKVVMKNYQLSSFDTYRRHQGDSAGPLTTCAKYLMDLVEISLVLDVNRYWWNSLDLDQTQLQDQRS